MKIPTKDGYIDRSELQVEFAITEEENNFIVHCIWKKDGELVRKDVWVNSKCGLPPITSETGQIGG